MLSKVAVIATVIVAVIGELLLDALLFGVVVLKSGQAHA